MPYNRLGFSSYKEKTSQLSPGMRGGRSPAEQGHVESTFTQFPSGVSRPPQKLAEGRWEILEVLHV